ncbi:DUF6249 domain-containing protein [Mucilaginibacter sp.]|jgi:intracellular septation protein A|uniref:DUF6249 domain-containing protein n=1 Tax=Mucilaginibacter sp. TaxID=1882438 RepID=UPI002632A643|nr:DUF6249 domain-containing protein [Mucilaginibacter sp.]MDB5129039.1 hypothetical protein [Mucilaginibacter sp.]
MDEGALVPILIPLGFFAMIFGIFYIRNRERMAMIERGMDPRLNLPQPHTNLRWGLLLIGCGLGLLLAYITDVTLMHREGEDNPAIYFSLIAIFGGLGLFISYWVDMKYLEKKK